MGTTLQKCMAAGEWNHPRLSVTQSGHLNPAARAGIHVPRG